MTRTLSLTLPALAVLYAVGAVWGSAEGFASFGDALFNGTYINAPLPIIALQAIGGGDRPQLAGQAAVAEAGGGAGRLPAGRNASLRACHRERDGEVGPRLV